MPLAATRIYQMSFFTGFGVSSLIYYGLNVLFPVKGASRAWEEIDVSNFSEKSASQVDESGSVSYGDEKTKGDHSTQEVFEA